MSSRDQVRVADPVKHVLHLGAGAEQQVAAVFRPGRPGSCNQACCGRRHQGHPGRDGGSAARCSSAIRCLYSPVLQLITGTPVVVAQALTRRGTGPRTIGWVLSRSSSEPAVRPPLPDPEPAACQPNCPKGRSFGAESRTGRAGNLAGYYWRGGRQGRTRDAMGSPPGSTGPALWVARGGVGSVAECGRTGV
jgi:hypothetical protein